MTNPRSIAIHNQRVFIADPAVGFVHVFDVDGDFLGRFIPRDGEGNPAAPMRCSIEPNGGLYIWTAGHSGHPGM